MFSHHLKSRFRYYPYKKFSEITTWKQKLKCKTACLRNSVNLSEYSIVQVQLLIRFGIEEDYTPNIIAHYDALARIFVKIELPL